MPQRNISWTWLKIRKSNEFHRLIHFHPRSTRKDMLISSRAMCRLHAQFVLIFGDQKWQCFAMTQQFEAFPGSCKIGFHYWHVPAAEVNSCSTVLYIIHGRKNKLVNTWMICAQQSVLSACWFPNTNTSSCNWNSTGTFSLKTHVGGHMMNHQLSKEEVLVVLVAAVT